MTLTHVKLAYFLIPQINYSDIYSAFHYLLHVTYGFFFWPISCRTRVGGNPAAYLDLPILDLGPLIPESWANASAVFGFRPWPLSSVSFSNLLFTSHPIFRHCMMWAVDCVLTETIHKYVLGRCRPVWWCNMQTYAQTNVSSSLFFHFTHWLQKSVKSMKPWLSWYVFLSPYMI
jgi:hypothetical protein